LAAVPEFKYVVLHVVPETSTAVAMLKTGKVDVTPITTLELDSLQNVAGIKTVPWTAGYQSATFLVEC